MKRIALIILVLFLIIFFCPSAASAEYKLKYDFQYLIKWVADKMNITIDPEKPLPKLIMLPQQEVQRLYEEKTGKLSTEIVEENGVKKELKVSGFYQPSENTIYSKDEVDLKKGETLEETIIHEMIHYFQRYYPSLFSQNFTCLQNYFPYRDCPRQREACKWEKLFRLEHGLTITGLDSECLENP